MTGLLSLCLLACGEVPVTEANQIDQTPFFDLKAYFASQVDSLQEAHPSVRKRLRINGREEEKEIDSIDFSAELAIFAKSDINRPAWFDKYLVDSVYQDQRLLELHYTAIDSSLKTRDLVIRFDRLGVDWITIDNLTSSLIADTRQHLQYDPSDGYRIESRQKIIFSSEKEVWVYGEFIP